VNKEQQIRSIWMVSREYEGLAGAGGVKDVCRQLAEALVRHAGCSVRVILPRYGFLDAEGLGFTLLHLPHRQGDAVCPDRFYDVFSVDMNYRLEERREVVSIWEKDIGGVRVYLVEAERFAEKLGVYTYTAAEEEKKVWQKKGSGHFDYFAMNILLQKAALDLMILLDEQPDVIHCHDGHAATLPAIMREGCGYRHYFRHSGAVVTIHNAGMGYHQEVDDLEFARAITGLPWHVIGSSRLGTSFDPFLAAAPYSVMNTVSENYARELQETDEDQRTGWLGHNLLQRGVRLAGITNGIDPKMFDPTDPDRLGLAAPFDPLRGDLGGKVTCKKVVLERISHGEPFAEVEQLGTLADDPDLPLLTFIGRLTAQKGVDVLVEGLHSLLEEDSRCQVLLLGSGDPFLEEQLTGLAETGSGAGRFCFLRGYAPRLATRIYAAGDFFLVPSLYEPCGLTDFMAQLLGNLPIVHHVGGLVKVLDGRTGFAYAEHDPLALLRAIQRALDVYRTDMERIRKMQKEAVEQILARYTWKQVMREYLLLYRQSLAKACR